MNLKIHKLLPKPIKGPRLKLAEKQVRYQGTYYQFITQNWSKRFKHLFSQKKAIQEYLETIYTTPSLENNEVFGFKIMNNQLNPLLVKILEENQYKVIKLVRKNHLRRLISYQKALKKGNWHSRKVKINYGAMYVATKNIIPQLRKLEKENKDIINAFPNLKSITIEYENLVNTTLQLKELEKICSFLEVNTNNVVTLKSNLKKISSNHLEDDVLNYEEIVSTLRNTEFEYLLSE